MRNGQVVTAKNYQGRTFKIVDLGKGQFATIREFNPSKQSLGELVLTVAIGDLKPFNEDASQAAARIVKEATEDR
jgi:hypothetical protein